MFSYLCAFHSSTLVILGGICFSRYHNYYSRLQEVIMKMQDHRIVTKSIFSQFSERREGFTEKIKQKAKVKKVTWMSMETNRILNIEERMIVMKKILAVCLALVFMLVAIPMQSVEAADNIKKRAGKVYADIIERYMEAYQIARNGGFEDRKKDESDQNTYPYKNGEWYDDVSEGFITASEMYKDAKAIYRIVDWNKDGTPDLFIGMDVDAGTGYKGVLAAYTFKGNKAVKLMHWGGYRMGTGVLCKDGKIKNYMSCGATCGISSFYKISKTKKLKTVLIEHDYYTNKYFLTKNGKKQAISEKKFNSLSKKYDSEYKSVDVKFYRVDPKALENMRKGIFSYKTQISIILEK